jgi:hypothetical protein
MRKRLPLSLAFLAAALLLAGGLLIGTRGAIAQDMASPAAGGIDHPAHIHEGTCATLGAVVLPLNNLVPPDAAATPEGDMGGMDMSASPMAEAGIELSGAESWSETTVEAALDDILAAEHAINVHESTDNIQNYIACGDLTGSPADGSLEITLMSLNDSGLEGGAVLQDNGDGTTTVTVWLMMESDATMEASPTT